MPAIGLFLLAAIVFAGYSVAIDMPNFDQPASHNQASIISTLLGNDEKAVSQEAEQATQAPVSVKTPVQTYSMVKTSTKTQAKTVVQEPGFSINTDIYATFANGTVFDETNKVTLRFKAIVEPSDTPGKVYFETKVLDYDTDWQEVSGDSKTFTLPYKSTEYTVLVRAGIGSVVDPTPAQKTFKINVSPYFNKLEFSSIKMSPAGSTLLKLSTNIAQGESVNITGWTIQKNEGASFIIPKGVEVYPASGNIVGQNIMAKKGDVIYVSGESNPLGGKDRSFKENKCTGYLVNDHSFPVSLSKSCPKPTSDEITFFEPCCKKYINQLNTCEVPNYDDLVKYGLFEDSQCLDYLYSRFGYDTCFARYSNDADFVKNTWHIFTGKNFTLGTSETCYDIYLYDANGLLVDKYHAGTEYCGKVKL